MTSGAADRQKQSSHIVERAWTDKAFKERLLREPAAVLRENGISVPDDVEVRVVENTQKMIHLVLSPQPEEELLEEDLSRGGGLEQGLGSLPVLHRLRPLHVRLLVTLSW